MTYQRDPERIVPGDDIVRREDIANRDAEIARRNAEATSSGLMPMIIAILLLLGVGYFAYTYFSPRAAEAPRTTEYSTPRTVPPTAPQAPSPSANTQTK